MRVTDYVRQAVYTDDWTTYLFDHVSIRLMAYLNPGATNELFAVPTEVLPEGFDRQITGGPVATELLLVNRLIIPRKQLKIWMNSDETDASKNQYLLVSPFPGRPVDARIGPVCKVHGLNTDHSNATLVADLQFETDINPIESKVGQSDSIPFILSNRWTYRISYDPETYAEVRILEGEAHFRADALLTASINRSEVLPDDMRGYIVPKPMSAYQREAPVFELSEDGTVLKYVIVDRLVHMSFPDGAKINAARIDVMEQRSYTQGLPLEDIVDRAERWIDDAWRWVAGGKKE